MKLTDTDKTALKSMFIGSLAAFGMVALLLFSGFFNQPIEPSAAEALTAFIPWITIGITLIAIGAIICPFFFYSEPVQKFWYRLQGKCYHDYDEFACELREWYHCTVCQIELRDPNSYHPWVIWKCTKCGKESRDIDISVSKSFGELSGVYTLQELEA